MPAFYPENNSSRASDDEVRSLHKLVSAGVSGGGGGSGAQLSGAGPPGAGLGSDGDLYVDRTNRDMYAKIGGAWELWLDVV